MSKGKFALGAVFGALVGTITGVLIAPKSGKETREDLMKKAEELKENSGELVDKAKKESKKVGDKVMKTADDLKDRTERAVDSAKKEFKKESKK